MRRLLLLTLSFLLPAPSHAAPTIHVFPAVGSRSRFTIRGRVLLESGERKGPMSALGRNVRRFMNAEWKHAPVLVRVAGERRRVEADDEGIFEAAFVLDGGRTLPIGGHDVAVDAPRGVAGSGRLLVLADDALVVVSDFDDTIAVTGVTSKGRMLRAAFLETEETQPAVPGMAELYRCLRDGGAAFQYLSGSPVQFFPRLSGFLARHGFPDGALTLRRLDSRALRARAFKQPTLERLFADLPTQRFLLVGDSGEQDPEVYAWASGALGDRAVGAFVRLVTEESPGSPRFARSRAFRAPSELAARLLERKLLPEPCVARVQAAERQTP